jgi:hypothetical protein
MEEEVAGTGAGDREGEGDGKEKNAILNERSLNSAAAMRTYFEFC